jgi:ADP-heptose:LPS heptosyltransferase
MAERLADIERIAVLRPNALGDFIFALPALHALRAAYPHARITYIGRQWHADFLRGRPVPVDEVRVIPPCPGVGAPLETSADEQAIAGFLAAMRKARFDLAMQLFGGGRYSNPFVRQFGARHTAGLRAEDAPPLDRNIRFGPLQNRRLQLLEAVALVGADSWRMERELTVTAQDRRAAQTATGHLTQPLALLQPGASDSRRCWPAERFARLADLLAGAGLQVAINGTEAERPVVRAVLEQARTPILDLSGRLSLQALCGLLERTSLLVSNDTGPLHLGLAVGTPCVGIYWLTNLFESGPLRQDKHRAALSLRTQCPVCGQENLTARCEHDSSFVDGVSVEEVADLAFDLLREDR